ncbi:DUF86 domain-containing protein [bacterium]|nr:DUF86 domain-containing protein [bacterium]
MKNESLKYLYDIRDATSSIKSFIEGITFKDYDINELIQSGVERKFEIVGEALNRIKKLDSKLIEKIREHRNIISFRNILAHGYCSVSNRIVWGIIEDDLENLIEDVMNLINNAEAVALNTDPKE